jgi:two-component system, NtrC family, nitrogen regulation sensor histidine kinase NtrY
MSIFLRIIILIFFILLAGILILWPSIERGTQNSSTHLLIFLFVNVNIIFLGVSGFLVGREFIRIVLDRRRNLLGSRLRLRLIIAFLGITVTPLMLVFILASGFLNRAIDGWFGNQVEASRDAAITLAREYYRSIKSSALARSNKIVRLILSREDLDSITTTTLIENARKRNQFYSIRIYDSRRNEIYRWNSAISSIQGFREPKIDQTSLIKGIIEDIPSNRYEGELEARYLRFYRPIPKSRVVVLTYRLDPDITAAFRTVRNSYEEYTQLKLFKNPLKSGYLLTFALMTGMLLFAAMWIAVQIARGIVEPLERLIQGTVAIAQGRYDIDLEEGGDDEFAVLISSFNVMARELKGSREEVEQQKRFVETILANLAVGVISIDRNNLVLLANTTSTKILGEEIKIGSKIEESVVATARQPLLTLLEEIEFDERVDFLDIQFDLQENHGTFKLSCSAGKLRSNQNEWIGTVLLLDDVTELSKAQALAAWREVARRIAHEIKNPLTPLKLSAQRLQRLLDKNIDSRVLEATTTIVEHVSSIQRLADEFSTFARMPRAVVEDTDCNKLVRDVVATYAESNPNFEIRCTLDSKIPLLSVDAEQMKRVLMNLFDNAVASLNEKIQKTANFLPKIMVKTYINKKRNISIIEITDNGIGIANNVKTNIFEPYYTTKSHGTGLGLAIVSSIINEHRGNIKLVGTTEGASFIIELPLTKTIRNIGK